MNVGAEFVPVEATVLAPPVSLAESKSASEALYPTSVRPAPRAAHVPHPRRVAGLVETAAMYTEPTGYASHAEPAPQDPIEPSPLTHCELVPDARDPEGPATSDAVNCAAFALNEKRRSAKKSFFINPLTPLKPEQV